MATLSERKPQASPTQPSFKMIMIGETGSGKTSVLQLLLNYAKQYGKEEFSLDEISSFGKSESEEKSKKKEQWDSDTTESSKYSAQYGDFTLDIIDTPGFCDTRGDDQDRVNIANIIAIVKKELYINCVCLIINGTQVRMTSVMKEVLTQIVSILPPSVLKNIIVVFTKVRDELSRKFDVKLLWSEFQLFVPKEYLFNIDNPYSRYESLTATPDKKQARMLKRDFEEAHDTLDDMFDVLKVLKPSLTLKFGEFQEVVDEIKVSFTKLKAHYHNKEKVRKLIDDVKTYGNRVNMVAYDKTITKESKRENLICEACLCNCHMECDCWGTFFSNWWCKRFKGGECTECSHGTDDHKLSKVYYEKVTEVISLPDEGYKA